MKKRNVMLKLYKIIFMQRHVIFVLLFSSNLLAYNQPTNELYNAIHSGDKEATKCALEKGDDPNDLLKEDPYFFSVLIPETTALLFTNSHKKMNPDLFCDYVRNIDINAPYLQVSGLVQFLKTPSLITCAKYKNLTVKRTLKPKIPRIIHHIWLTNSSQKKEISPKNIENVLRTKDIFLFNIDVVCDKFDAKEWQHIVWTNDKSLILASVEILKSNGVQIREVFEAANCLKLRTKVEELIEQERWGMASDILRYDLINCFGGVYADLNYEFERDIEAEVHKYDFFASSYHGSSTVAPCLIGAKANHPVLNTALNLVERNLNSPPKYITSLDDIIEITDMTTVQPLTYAYYISSNNNTIDVVYPEQLYTRTFDDIGEGTTQCLKVVSILGKYVSCEEELSFLKKLCEFEVSDDICGTKSQLIGFDAVVDGLSWVNVSD